MYGKNVEELNVYIRTEMYGEKTLTFSRTGDQGQFWDRSVVTNSKEVYFQFIIEGVTSNSDLADIAIDDISFTESCLIVNDSLPDGNTYTPRPSPCADDEFYCGVSFDCIPESQRCDWKKDCPNNADEDYCGECNFEYNTCDWYDASAGMYSWGRISASDSSHYTHPNVDHTFHSSDGHYVYVEGGVGIEGTTAVFNSPQLVHGAGYYCELHFWLYLGNASDSQLELYTYHEGYEEELLYTLGASDVQEKEWFKVIAPARLVPSTFYFSFRATPTFSTAPDWEKLHSVLAMDDISFFNCNEGMLSLGCDFDDEGLCTWRQDESDQQDWEKKGALNSSLTDHTSGEGYYMSVDFTLSLAKPNDKARLISTVQSEPGTYTNVLTLWYYFYGENVGTFRIIIIKETSKETLTLFEVSTSQEDRWLQYHEPLSVDDDFTVVLEGEWGEVGLGLLAVDDIQLTAELHESVCDFEFDFCQWTPSNETKGVWTRGQGDQNLTATPPVDHTQNTGAGYYAYLKAGGEDQVGYLTSPVYKSVGVQCLRFWYHMLGDHVGLLQVETSFNGYGSIIVWGHSENTFEMWFQGMVTLEDRQEYSVRFSGSSGSNNLSVIALDDVTFVPDKCPQLYVCDFEYDMCEWLNSDEDEFDWVRSSSAEGGGIIADHTTDYETGHYLVTQLENKKKGDRAQLFGPVVPSRHKCMTFWYSMQHIVNATLIVKVLEDEAIPLVELHNSSLLYQWEEVSVTPDVLVDNYEIMIELLVNEDITFSEYYTIAIDDTAFTEDCSVHTLPPYTTPLPTHLPSSFDCDFEQDESETCGWIQDTEDGTDWERWQGSTPSIETGPQADHTLLTSDGHYIYSGTFMVHNETTAALKSPTVDIGSKGGCLTFWYHMHGFDVGILQVMSQKVGSTMKDLVWQRLGEQGDGWLQTKVHFTAEGLQSMVIQSTLKTAGAGDIAIDDITFDYGNCHSGNVCDFELDNICNFEQSLEDDLNWELVMASDADVNLEKHPKGDHSLQSPLGHYLKLLGEGLAVLYTSEIDPQFSCVEFSLYLNGFYGYGIPDVSVYIRRSGILDPEPEITITNTIGDSWSRYILQVLSSEPYSLAFQSHMTGSGFVLGLDDVKPLIFCEPMKECNFETDLCMWKNLVDDDQFDWSLTSGEDLSHYYAPTVDVTLGSPLGKFAYVDTTREPSTLDAPEAILESVVLESEWQCVRFWYHMQGVGEATLAIRAKNVPGEETSKMWESSSIVYAEWKYQQVSVREPRHHTVQFVAISDKGHSGIIAIDQVIIDPGQCTNQTVPDCVITCDNGNTCIHESHMCNFIQECGDGEDERLCGYNCTFEETGEEHCMWSNVGANNEVQLWELLSGERNNTNAPPLDHTLLTPSGHYMALVPGEGGQVEGEVTAIMQSPYMYNSASYCLMTFWYVMYGRPDNASSTDIGSLSVMSQFSDLSVELLTLEGSQGDEWRYAVAYVGRITEKFTLQFKGDRNLDMSGYIAVDDIKLDSCFLPTPNSDPEECTRFLCANQACVSTFETCDFVDDCGDYSDEDDDYAECAKFAARCSFEEGSLCDWAQEGPDDWLMGSPSSDELIPKRDHTTNTPSGSYIYIGSSQDSLAASSASLVSPVMGWNYKLIDPCMLRFFYYMDGPSVDELVVAVREASGGTLNEQWSMTGAVGPLWERKELSVPPHLIMYNPLQFVIKGKTLNGTGEERSVIAIDDVSFSETCYMSSGTLPPTSPTVPTTGGPCEGKFQCENGQCVPLDYVCNFVKNCNDGTDEAMCAECDFERNTCGWSDASSGNYIWLREESGDIGKNGQAMKVEERTGYLSKAAELESVQLQGSSSSCIMQFYYYKHYGDYGSTGLHLYVKSEGGSEYRAWYVLDDMGDAWHEQTVRIGEHEAGWSLRFEGTHFDEEGLILVDDIHFENCTLPSATVCKPDQTKCVNGACVEEPTLCDFNDDCGDGTDELPGLCQDYHERCSFEDDFCRWTQENETIEWIRRTGEMLAEDLGPDYDHTFGNETGYYLYLMSAEGDKGKTARISSTTFYPAILDCHFRFWYMIKANQSAKLAVYVEEASGAPRQGRSIIFQTEGSAEYGWLKADSPVNFARYFKIVMEGTVGEKLEGDVSIDDISFTPNCLPLHVLPTTSTSPPPGHCQDDEFECQSSECIPNTSVCDFRYDCADSSDEMLCPSFCNFEVDTCGWQEAVDDSLNWIWAQANDSTVGTDQGGPYVDASGLTQGHFLLLRATTPDLAGEEGFALSHWYQNAAPYCHFTYWYYVTGEQQAAVILQLNTTETEKLNLTFLEWDTATGDGIWHWEEVGIGRRQAAFQLSLYREPYPEYSGHFAVDDMDFTQSCHFDQPSQTGCASDEYHCSETKVG